MTETFVMIHGMWGGEWYWDKFKHFLEGRGYRCETVTLRYHKKNLSKSEMKQLGKTSLIDYVNDAEKAITQLELSEKPIIMGHSMGGLIAQILASRGMAKKLVLLTPAAPAGIRSLTWSVFWCFIGVSFQIYTHKPMRLSFNKAEYAMLSNLYENKEETYNKLVYESGRAAFEIGHWFLLRSRPSEVDEDKISCPILLIASDKDNITPVSVIDKIAKKYKIKKLDDNSVAKSSISEYKVFSNHAHWVIAEPDCEVIIQYISNWLDLSHDNNSV